MAKADLLLQYSGLFYLLILATQFFGVLSNHHHHHQITLTPSGPDLVKYVNASTMVTCTPSTAQMKVRWISPTGDVVGNVVHKRIHTEMRENGAVALVLSWITRKEAGDWKCESLSGEEQISQRFTLHVIQDIVFADTPIVQEGVEGQTAVIRCEASGDPLPRMQWYHNGKPIPEPSKKYRKVGDGLVINSLRRSDSGEYTCGAYQVSPHISNAKSLVIRFNVLHAPIFLSQRSVYYAYYYGTAELTCDVLADPPAAIQWTSKPVPAEFFTLHNDTINSSILEIAVNDPVVIGKYTCRATNQFGTVERTVELRNGSKPSPPNRFIIKGVNNTTVHIEVEQQQQQQEEDASMNEYNNSSDDADLVTGYRFQFISLDNYKKYRQRKNDNFWFPQGELNKNYSENNSYLVGGLRPNTIYKIRVASLNKAGPSDFTTDKEFATSGGGRLWLSLGVLVVVVLCGRWTVE